MAKRSDLIGCKVIIPADPYSYDVLIQDESGNNVACVHIPPQANVTAKFKKTIAVALKEATGKNDKAG